MKILEVKKVEDQHGIAIRVLLQDEGELREEIFGGEEWLEKDKNGEEKFLERLRQNKRDLLMKPKETSKVYKQKISKLNKFNGKEVFLNEI